MPFQQFASEKYTGHHLAPIYQLVSEVDGAVLFEQKGWHLSDFYKSIRADGWKQCGHNSQYMLRYSKTL